MSMEDSEDMSPELSKAISVQRLFDEICFGDEAKVREKMSEVGDPNCRSPFDRTTPIAAAVKAGSRGAIAAILEMGGDPFVANADGDSALSLAAKAGDCESIRKFVACDGFLGDAGIAAAKMALSEAKAGLESIAEILWEASGSWSAEAREDFGGDAVLAAAMTSHSSCALLRRLLADGAKTDKRDSNGWDAVHWAVHQGSMEALEALLDAGAPTEAKCWLGMRPIHRAAATWRKDMMEALVERGAKAAMKDKRGRTALHWVAKSNPSPSNFQKDAVDYAVSLGIPIDEEDGEGRTALHEAARYGSVEAVRALLAHGAVQRKGGSQSSPLHVVKGATATRVLLAAGGEVDEPDGTGETPLFKAIREKDAEAAAELLSFGANPRARRRDGKSALFFATAVCAVEVAEILLMAGADASDLDDMDLPSDMGPLMERWKMRERISSNGSNSRRGWASSKMKV